MTTPFSLAPAAAVGAMPATNAPWDLSLQRFWLGQPSTMMVELPALDPTAYTVEGSRSRVEHGLGSGGSAVTQLPFATRRWGLAWPKLQSRDYDRIKALDAGMFGDELIYVQPEDRNHLTFEQSMCGALSGTPNGWSTSGTAIYDPTLPPPIEPSGVFRWTPASSTDRLVANYGDQAIPHPDFACPYLPAMPCVWWAWLRSDSGSTSVQLRLAGRDAAGNSIMNAIGGTVTLTTTWQQYFIAAAPGALGASLFVLPVIGASSTAPIRVACAQFEYRAAPTDWTAGGGCPRVDMPGTLPRTLDAFLNSQLPVTLAETVAGAC